MNGRKDVFKRAEGTETATVTNPETAIVVPEKKFSLTNTTDKVGITTAGQLTRAFWWGMVFATVGLLVAGTYFKKVSFNYVK